MLLKSHNTQHTLQQLGDCSFLSPVSYVTIETFTIELRFIVPKITLSLSIFVVNVTKLKSSAQLKCRQLLLIKIALFTHRLTESLKINKNVLSGHKNFNEKHKMEAPKIYRYN